MKSAIVLCVLSVIAMVLARPDGDKYTDKYDETNIEEILHNAGIFKNYFNCMMDRGKCTPDAKELKEHMVEALENNCAKCTEMQKEKTKTVIRFLIKEKAAEWKEVSEKYDPKKIYATKYEKEIEELKQ